MTDELPDPKAIMALCGQGASTHELTDTVIDELSPGDSLSGNAHIAHILRRFGYTGHAGNDPAIVSFLLSTLQAHRILAHEKPCDTVASAPDKRLTDELSRLLTCLDISPSAKNDVTLSTICDALQNANKSLMHLLQSNNMEPPKPLLSDSDCQSILDDSHRKALAERILTTLQREHVIRVGMLLTRLHVTIQSFSRSDRAQADPAAFGILSHRAQDLQARWSEPNQTTLYQVISLPRSVVCEPAENYIGMIPKSAPNRVKEFVMGAVPDRGGRLAAGKESEMPKFRTRDPNVSGSKRSASGQESAKRRHRYSKGHRGKAGQTKGNN